MLYYRVYILGLQLISFDKALLRLLGVVYTSALPPRSFRQELGIYAFYRFVQSRAALEWEQLASKEWHLTWALVLTPSQRVSSRIRDNLREWSGRCKCVTNLDSMKRDHFLDAQKKSITDNFSSVVSLCKVTPSALVLSQNRHHYATLPGFFFVFLLTISVVTIIFLHWSNLFLKDCFGITRWRNLGLTDIWW